MFEVPDKMGLIKEPAIIRDPCKVPILVVPQNPHHFTDPHQPQIALRTHPYRFAELPFPLPLAVTAMISHAPVNYKTIFQTAFALPLVPSSINLSE
jgi:hypothetical protein